MKTLMKRTMAVLLMIVMMLSAMPFDALAANTTVEIDPDTLSYTAGKGLMVYWDPINNTGTMYFQIVVKVGDEVVYNNDPEEAVGCLGGLKFREPAYEQSMLIPDDVLIPGEEHKIYIKAFAEDDVTSLVLSEGGTVYFTVPEGDYLEIVSPNNGEVEVGAEGDDEITVQMQSSANWQASCNASWISLISRNGGPSNGQFFAFSVKANNAEARSATISIKMGGMEEELTVYQDGKASVEDMYLDITPMSITDGGAGGAYSLTVESNIEWKAKVSGSDVDWISINKTSGNGDETITVTVEGNTSGSERSGKVLVDSVDYETIDITNDIIVTQSAGAPVEPEQLATPELTLSSTELEVGDVLTVTWDAIQNADYYTAVIWDMNQPEGNGHKEIDRRDIESGTSYTSVEMPYAGDNFVVGVYARSYNPDQYKQSGDDNGRYFTVAEPVVEPGQLATPELTLSSTELEVGDVLTVTWDAIQNADYYTAVIWDMNQPEGNGHKEIDRRDIESGTSYTSVEMPYAGDNFVVGVYARSYNPDQYKQSGDDNGRYFMVAEPVVEPGQLATPVADQNQYMIKINTNVTFGWSDVTNAEAYVVRVYDAQSNFVSEKEVADSEVVFAFAGAGTYWIDIYAIADGYEQSDKCTITVTAEVAAPTLTISSINVNESDLRLGDSFSISGTVDGGDYAITRISVSVFKDGGAHGVKIKTVDVNAGSFNLSSISGLSIPETFTCQACGTADSFADDEEITVAVYAYSEEYGDTVESRTSFTLVPTIEVISASIATLDVLDEDITSNSVTVTGQIAFGNGETAASYDCVGIQYGIYQSEWAATVGTTLNADGSFTAEVTGLNPETTYAFHAVAKNASTQKWLNNSNVVTATTSPDVPVVPIAETLDVNVIDITAEGAILRGKVTDNGGAAVTQWGFALREAGSIDWPTRRFEGSLAENVVEEYEVRGLDADTEYEFYFYARNSVGESVHGNQVKTFRTAAEGDAAPSMIASLKVPAESVEADEDVYFIFNVENCDKVQLVADGQYGFVIDLLTDTNVKELGEGKYEWKYAFNKPGEKRKIQFIPYNGEAAGVVTEAIILDVTAYLNLNCDTTIEPGKWGGDGEEIQVDCNVEWTATTDSPSWIMLNADVENDTLNHTYTRNSGYKTREGTITLSAPGCTSIVIKVVQQPAPAELVFEAGMNGNSQLQLGIHSGALNPDDTYTMKIYDQSGKLMGTATRTLSSGFSAESWSIGNPSAGDGLQLPRAATYTVKVLDSAGKAQQFIDSNGNKRDHQNVTIPLWNGDMIKWVKSGSTTVQNGGTLTWGQDISVHWDGSYGVENTVITMTVGQKTISITELSDGELTTTFVANGDDGYMTEILEEMQPTLGSPVDVVVAVSISQNGFKRKEIWNGKISNTDAASLSPEESSMPNQHEYELYVDNEYYNPDQHTLLFDSRYYITEDFGIRNKTTGEIKYIAQWNGYGMNLAENYNSIISFEGTRMSIRRTSEGVPATGHALLQLVDLATGTVVDEIIIRSTHIERDDLSGRPETLEDYVTVDSFDDFVDEFGLAGEKGITISEGSLSADSGVMIFNFYRSSLRNDKPNEYPDGYYSISFDAFNTTPIAFEVNAYDSNMRRVNDSAYIIKGYTKGFSVWNAGNAMVNDLVDDVKDGKFGFITGEYTAAGKTETHISIEVPNGGYLRFEEGKPDNNNDASWENLANALLSVISVAQGANYTDGKSDATYIIDAAYDNPMNTSEFAKILKAVGGDELMQELMKNQLKGGGSKEIVKTLVEALSDPNGELGAILWEAIEQYTAQLPENMINSGLSIGESRAMKIAGLGGMDTLVDLVLAGEDLFCFVDYMWNDKDGLVVHYIAMPKED